RRLRAPDLHGRLVGDGAAVRGPRVHGRDARPGVASPCLRLALAALVRPLQLRHLPPAPAPHAARVLLLAALLAGPARGGLLAGRAGVPAGRRGGRLGGGLGVLARPGEAVPAPQGPLRLRAAGRLRLRPPFLSRSHAPTRARQPRRTEKAPSAVRSGCGPPYPLPNRPPRTAAAPWSTTMIPSLHRT